MKQVILAGIAATLVVNAAQAGKASVSERMEARRVIARMAASLDTAGDDEKSFLRASGSDEDLFDSFACFLGDKSDRSRVARLMRACSRLGLWGTMLEIGKRAVSSGRSSSPEIYALTAKAYYRNGAEKSAFNCLAKGMRRYPRSRGLRRAYFLLGRPRFGTESVKSWSKALEIAERDECLAIGRLLARASKAHINSGKEPVLIAEGPNSAEVEKAYVSTGLLPGWYPVGRFTFVVGYSRLDGRLTAVNEKYGYERVPGTAGDIPLVYDCEFDGKVLDRALASTSADSARLMGFKAVFSIRKGLDETRLPAALRVLEDLGDGFHRREILYHLLRFLRCNECKRPELLSLLEKLRKSGSGLTRLQADWALAWCAGDKRYELSDDELKGLLRWPDRWNDRQPNLRADWVFEQVADGGRDAVERLERLEREGLREAGAVLARLKWRH